VGVESDPATRFGGGVWSLRGQPIGPAAFARPCFIGGFDRRVSAYLFLLSTALYISHDNWKLLPIAIAWTLLFTVVAFGVIYLGVRIEPRSESYEFVQWPLLYAMLALSFGSWIVWRQARATDR